MKDKVHQHKIEDKSQLGLDTWPGIPYNEI